MQSFVQRSTWRILSVISALVLISGCVSRITPTQVDSTIQGAYPIIDETHSVPSSAYPASSGGEQPIQTVDSGKVITPKGAPQPEKDKASASGVIYSISSRAVLWNFEIYFTPAQGDKKDEVPPLLVGSFKEKGDILVKADKKGEFQINNIAPGNYYIVLVAPGDYLLAVKSLTDPTPRMVTLKPNEGQPLGLIFFP